MIESKRFALNMLTVNPLENRGVKSYREEINEIQKQNMEAEERV